MTSELSLPKQVEPLQGETVTWKRSASRVQSPRRAVGGRLYLTSHRLVFMPHAFDATFEGQAWQAPLDIVTAAGQAERNWGQHLAGGLRKRLWLLLTDGTQELFVINKLDWVIDQICSTAEADRF